VTEIERVGIYRIESLLGRGGMGEVFLAWDEILERHVAIKKVLAEVAAGSIQRQRFLREARAVARLDHPAIVRIYHVLERDDGDCLVMEYVKGQDLAKVVAGGRVEMVQATLLARGIAEGLAEAHAIGLVHRDLKLANVMITLSGAVKILDFGLAKARDPGQEVPRQARELGQEPSKADLTSPGSLMGTAFAMSPEQVEGEELDARSDLFSLGGLIYELLTGIRPFQGSSLVDTLHKVLLVEPQPVENLVPGLPDELATLVKDLLAKEKEQRPRSAQEVVDRLIKILDLLGAAQAVPSPTFAAASSESEGTLADPCLPTADLPAGRRMAALPAPSVALRTVASLVEVHADTDSRLGLLRCARATARRFDAQELVGSGVDFLFRRPAEAVAFALAVQSALAQQQPPLVAAIALHLGEVTLPGAFGRAGMEGRGELIEKAHLLARRAQGRQILLSRTVFDLARGARAPAELADPAVRWLAHGSYYAGGDDEPTEIFEVGLEGLAPLSQPADSPELRRSPHLSQDIALGWRPAVGQDVPRRPLWTLVERLGAGGFGEVWLARHVQGEERVFKFCFDPVRLRALKREVTIFRLLRETLGRRQDIARLIDWDFEQVPYFLESAYTDGGDLPRWAQHRGGLAEIPLATRLELVAQVADALAAAHSVGVLHKDVKPQNVLVGHDQDGRPRAVLTDFGLGLLTSREALEGPGFTVLGFTETSQEVSEASGGTPRYMAPELLAGKPATIEADVFSLGILLYQMVVGDFSRGLAEGWRREIQDELLAADVTACVDGNPERRLRGPTELAERIRTLEARHRQRQEEEAAVSAAGRTQRRRRVAAWLGAAAAVLLPLLSIFAYQTYQAKNQERQAREQAEQRRQQAESLIDFMLGDLRQQLQPIGKLKILDQVGDRALDYFAKVPEGELSAAEMANYAKALHQIGQVRFGLGKKPEAGEAFEASLVMAKRLAASDPANSQWQFELGQSHFWVGFLRWKERKLDQALAEFEAYLRISETLVARDPANQDWQLELAFSHSNIGSILEEQSNIDGAAKSLEASLRVFEALIRRQPGSTQLLVEAAGVDQKLGEVLHRRGDLSGSLSWHRTSLHNYEVALGKDPENAQLLFYVGTAKGYVGNVLLDLGNSTEALELFLSDMETMQHLADRDPESFTNKELLSLRINKVGRAYMATGNLAMARKEFERERALTLELIAKDSESLNWRFARARNQCSWALLYTGKKEPKAAIPLAEECRARLAEFVAASQDRTYRLWLARAYLILSLANRAIGEQQVAALRAAEGAKIALPLVENSPLPSDMDIYVRLLVGMNKNTEAQSWIRRLSSIKYKESSYELFLDIEGA